MSRSLTEFRLERQFQIRIYQFSSIALIVFLILLSQLGYLQILHGYENRILAKKFVSRQEFTAAPRGLVYDRNGPGVQEPIIKNINYVNFEIYPSRFKSREDGENFLKRFSQIMGISYENYRSYTKPSTWRNMVRRNESITLIERLSRKEHERLAGFQLLSENGEFVTNHLRYYPMGPALAHITGYVGLPSRRELDLNLVQSYQQIGKGGLEARYDSDLRGTDGVKIRHRIMDSEEQISRSEQGNNLILTIDSRLQETAFRGLQRSGLRGTVIAMKPATGEILAMASVPSFDPNILSSGTTDQRTEHYFKVNEEEGFLNLAIQAKFPPASTFKPLVALAALESGENEGISEETTFFCPGKWTLQSTVPGVPPSNYYCWKPHGHGKHNLIGAIANSCNVYFYQLGYKIGPTPIIQYARAFGLDKKSGIDLPGEISGFVPDQRWKQITWSSRWYDGDTINLSIGQGFLETTPMAVAIMYSAIVNGGKVYRPYLIRNVQDPFTGRLLRKYEPELVNQVPVKQKNLISVRKGMREMVLSGTGRYLNRKPFPPIAGKTGTVQTRSKVDGQNHAWFAGFAPYDAPLEEQIVVVVFLEYGMGGAATAVPIAGEVFKTAFPEKKEPPAYVPTGLKKPEGENPNG